MFLYVPGVPNSYDFNNKIIPVVNIVLFYINTLVRQWEERETRTGDLLREPVGQPCSGPIRECIFCHLVQKVLNARHATLKVSSGIGEKAMCQSF